MRKTASLRVLKTKGAHSLQIVLLLNTLAASLAYARIKGYLRKTARILCTRLWIQKWLPLVVEPSRSCQSLFFIFPKMCFCVDTVFCCNLSNYSARVACGKYAAWNIASNYRTGTDYRTLADCYAAADSNVTGNPAVGGDSYRLGVFFVGHYSATIFVHSALGRQQWMHGRYYAYSRANKYVIADIYRTAVEYRQVEVGEAIFAKGGKYAVVEVVGALQILAVAGYSLR